MTEDLGMEEILAQSPGAETGAVIESTVVSLSDSYLLVDVGLKQEAALPLKEFSGDIPFTGSKLPVLILRMRGPEGRSLVSWRQAREKLHWDRLTAAHEKNEPIEGKVVKRIKGGVLADVGVDAFMPASQIDEKPVADIDAWVGREVRVLVLEMDRSKGNVLVSRRRLLEQERAIKRAVTLGNLKEGLVMQGKVTGLTNFGAFIDVGGIEGLLHISDMDWIRVTNPKKVLSVGQEVDVKVLKYDPATHRISLGRKQLLPHPLDGLDKRIPLGTVVKGKVTGLSAFGAFVEIEPGVEGLIHLSELSWTEKIQHPKDVLKVGQMIDVRLLAVDRAKEKVSLSLKRVGLNPWEEAARTFPVGTVVEGEVTHVAAFGVFVRIRPGVEALLKSQDLSWTEMASPSKMFKAGDKLKARVLEMDVGKEKMALGLKQLTPDPMTVLKVGHGVKGKVTNIVDFGIFVKLDSGLDGLVRIAELTHQSSKFYDPQEEHVLKDTPDKFKEGEEIAATVIKINKKERKIELSIKRYDRDQEKELLKKYSGTRDTRTLAETTGWGDGENQP